MTSRSRSRLAGAVLAMSVAVPLAAAGPASADLVPQLPPVDTTCLNAAPTDILQCEISSVQGTVTSTLTTVTSQTLLTTGTTGTSTPSLGTAPTASGGTTQQSTTGSTAATRTKKRHYRFHRSGHHRRR
jgi:hypothetical protein